MASITIPDLDEALESRLRTQADSHGLSVEAEARAILYAALNREPPRAGGLVASIRAKFAPLGGMELPQIPRAPMREPPFQDEARDIPHAALNREPPRKGGLVESIRAKIAPLGGVELPHIPREPMREPPFQDE